MYDRMDLTVNKIVVPIFLTLSRVYMYDRMDLSQSRKLWFLYFLHCLGFTIYDRMDLTVNKIVVPIFLTLSTVLNNVHVLSTIKSWYLYVLYISFTKMHTYHIR